MRIVLFGKNGQVGRALLNTLPVIGEVIAFARNEVDFTQVAQIRHVLELYQPQLIVNAAAYTAVDLAEQEPKQAYAINAKAVSVLAVEAKRLGAWLVHYSTDYVFDGKKDTAYTESDFPHPLSVYGQTKWAGEQAIQQFHSRYLIFRTSWLYDSQGNNFVKKILSAAINKPSLRVVSDQIGSPTSAQRVAQTTTHVLQRLEQFTCGRLYHLCAQGNVSWYEYARYILHSANEIGIQTKATAQTLYPISSSDCSAGAKRPANSSLATKKIQTDFGIKLPHWKTDVGAVLNKIRQGALCEQKRDHSSRGNRL